MAKPVAEGTFKYFAYGSNLLRERIIINNPSARFLGIGKLKGYRFNFDLPEGRTSSNAWLGSPATISEAEPSSHVYGVIWDVHMRDMVNLDNQERVYQALQVDVEIVSMDTPNRDDTDTPQSQSSSLSTTPGIGDLVQCRTYQLPSGTGQHLPSPHYKRVIVMGAHQNNLPQEYIAFLESFPDNQETETPPAYHRVVNMMKRIHGDDLPEYLKSL